MFLMIENENEIALAGIRLLGFSPKEDHQIGRFGTGLKEAIALLCRRGTLPVIFSGTNRIEFSIQGDPEEISFRMEVGDDTYEADKWYGLGLHPDFGKHDWSSEWQALREVFCNAYDEVCMNYTMVNEREGVEGYTRVYIQADPGMCAEFGLIESKLKFLSSQKARHYCDDGSAWDKGPLGDKAQIYHKGVWVQADRKPSVFDYDCKELALNESRSADRWKVCGVISKIIVSLPPSMLSDVMRAVSGGVLDPDGERVLFLESDIHGWQLDNMVAHNKSSWLKAWAIAFGDKHLAVPVNNIFVAARVVDEGYLPVAFNQEWMSLIEAAGIPTYKTALSENVLEGIKILDMQSTAFDDVWKHALACGYTARPKPKCLVFEFDGKEGDSKGFVRDDTVHIHKSVLGSDDEYKTCIEEIVHVCSGAADCSRPMQNAYNDFIFRLAFPGYRS